MKLPLVYTDLCCKQVFESATSHAAAHLWTMRVASFMFWWLFHLVRGHVVFMTVKKHRNSVTIESMTHIDGLLFWL
jgi:hypothetical protein